MRDREPNFSRSKRKKGRKQIDTILNILISVVALLIVIATVIIVSGNGDKKQVDKKEEIDQDNVVENEDPLGDPSETSKEDRDSVAKESESSNPVQSEDSQKADDQESAKEESKVEEDPEVDLDAEDDSDEIVSQTVVNPSWQPLGTEQTGEHISSYDEDSIDLLEKKEAIAYATGEAIDSLIFWRVKNGGGPQKSIGIVESRVDAGKYRVYIEWVDGQGWKPTKMDVLNTLDFEY